MESSRAEANLDAIEDARYFCAALDASRADALFAECVDLPLDAARSGCGPRTRTYRGDSDALPPELAATAAALVEHGLLSRPPTMISVNHYDRPVFQMLPHKDGFVEQAAVLSLAADCVLSFWRVAMTNRQRAAREAFRTQWSGTEVFDELAGEGARRADFRVWLEPGSVLLLEGSALEDWAHGVAARSVETFDFGREGGEPARAPIANAAHVDVAALRGRCGAGKCDSQRSIVAPRRERVSVVMWTAMRASPLAAALSASDDAEAEALLDAALAALRGAEGGAARLARELATVGGSGVTPLGVAVGRGDAPGGEANALARRLLDAGAHPDGVPPGPSGAAAKVAVAVEEEVEEEKETPLTRCAAVRAGATATLLLARGADCERCDVVGASPLTAAAKAGATSVCKALLAAGAEVGRPDARGDTAVGVAAAHGRDAVVSLLLATL
jgi:hypothetical protein